MVTVRFFAAARAEVGSAQVSREPASIDGLLAPFDSPVLRRSSFLVNGIATTDRATVLSGGDVLDVLPPFAGG
jgi:molybdopterin synthase sulfur carrier subunit